MTTHELRAAIRDAGLRATHQRVTVLGLLASRGEPMSQTDVSARLAGPRERSTVYRNLSALARAGLVRRFTLGDRVWRFEYAGHSERHPHFVCTSCGKVTCVAAAKLVVPRVRAPRAVRRGEVEVQLRGLCDACCQ